MSRRARLEAMQLGCSGVDWKQDGVVVEVYADQDCWPGEAREGCLVLFI
jgi:hypothetical protein